MIPTSKIKQQLKKTMDFKRETPLAGKDIINTIKQDNILAPNNITPGSVSIMSFLQTKKDNTNTDKFISMQPIKYYYYPIEFLNKDIDKINMKGKTVNICIYMVDTTTTKPFLTYLLNKLDNKFTWPFFQLKTNNIKKECETKLINLQILNNTQFKGYINFSNEIYMFYKIDDNFEYKKNIEDQTPFWFVTMYEILFARRILYYEIVSKVYNLFIKERRLQYLLDKKNLYYQIPLVLYNGAPSHKLDFYLKAGLLKASITASQGPYYYFANYLRAAKFGSWNVVGGYKEEEKGGELITDNEFGRYIRGGIIRFIVYPGKQKVVLNRSWDKENPQIKRDLEMDNIKKKIYDTKSSWIKEYDSVLLGPLETAPNQKIHNGISLTVKSYYQYKSLSYHYLDKKSIPQKYTPDIDKDYWNINKNKYFKIE